MRQTSQMAMREILAQQLVLVLNHSLCIFVIFLHIHRSYSISILGDVQNSARARPQVRQSVLNPTLIGAGGSWSIWLPEVPTYTFQ